MVATHISRIWGDIYQTSIVVCVRPRLLSISNSSRLGFIPRHATGQIQITMYERERPSMKV
jgi:hypothetical protein